MGCWGQREKFDNPDNEQKWDYINLSDFRSSSCGTSFSYGILYIFLIISVAVYAVDLFTCANLLLFDKWSGQVKPAIPFEISRWIFTGCIVLSYVLLVFRWWRAVKAMKSGVVAASYLDPLAVRVQSVRLGANGRGWRRFLVFAALTKGRKGTEYVALFTYFSFEAWLRICFAEGPRQVINALTLYSVMQADLVPAGQHAAKNGHSPVVQFFANVQILANEKKEQAAILFGMLFTLVIWVFSALSLLMAVIFYITYLFHHIRDGSLSRYCRRKIDSRLHKIVMVKVNKALSKDNRVREKQTAGGVRAGATQDDLKRQPTLPVLEAHESMGMKPISRQTTQTDVSSLDSLPTRSTSNSTFAPHREPTVPDVLGSPQRPQSRSRSVTQNLPQSDARFADNAPLISSAALLGYGAPDLKDPSSRFRSERALHSYKPPGRSLTGATQASQRSYGSSSLPMRPPSRQNTDVDGGSMPVSGPSAPQVRKPMPHNMSVDPRMRNMGPPAPVNDRIAMEEFEMLSQPPRPRTNIPLNNSGYVAFNPNTQYSGHSAVPLSYPAPPSNVPQRRNITQPERPPQANYFATHQGTPQRSGTAPLPAASYDTALIDAYGGSWQQARSGPISNRPATTGPENGRQMPPRY